MSVACMATLMQCVFAHSSRCLACVFGVNIVFGMVKELRVRLCSCLDALIETENV